MSRARVLLFDWTTGGHHPVYLRRAAEALADVADTVVAAPAETLAEMTGAPAAFHALPDARPREDLTRPVRPQTRRLGEAELERLRAAIGETRPSSVIHMYADPVMRLLVRGPRLPVPVSVLLLFPTAHYPSAFGSPLARGERLSATYRDLLVRRWRRRPDAGVAMTLDPVAAAAWAARRGAPAAWLPEPPVTGTATADRTHDVVVYGALSRHKGLGRLADAVAAGGAGLRILLAGSVAPELHGELDGLLARMTGAGAILETRLHRHTEAEGLEALASARCAVLAYPRHRGSSRVLLEAATVGTPVVADRFGLLGHLVREHGLGETVDCDDPMALAAAIRSATAHPEDVVTPALRDAFIAMHDGRRFASALALATIPAPAHDRGALTV